MRRNSAEHLKRKEIETYSRLECSEKPPYGYWWSRRLFKLLSDAERALVDIWANSYLKNKRCLILGCGGGGDLLSLNGLANEIVGIDISDKQIYKAAKIVKDAHLVVCDAEILPFRRNSFEAVFCKAILHHLPNLSKALVEIKYALKDNGILFIGGEPGILNLIAAIGRRFFPSRAHTPGERPFIFSVLRRQIKATGFAELRVAFFHLISHGLALKIMNILLGENVLRKLILKLLLENSLSRSFLKNLYWVMIAVYRKRL